MANRLTEFPSLTFDVATVAPELTERPLVISARRGPSDLANALLRLAMIELADPEGPDAAYDDLIVGWFTDQSVAITALGFATPQVMRSDIPPPMSLATSAAYLERAGDTVWLGYQTSHPRQPQYAAIKFVSHDGDGIWVPGETIGLNLDNGVVETGQYSDAVLPHYEVPVDNAALAHDPLLSAARSLDVGAQTLLSMPEYGLGAPYVRVTQGYLPRAT